MRRLLKEPLVHFVLLGAALFGLHGWMRPVAAAHEGEIVVSAGQIEHLATAFARVWQRPPTTGELKGMIDDHVKEEILSREAIALGLDQGDVVIRRRLRQKMEFVAEDLALTVEPEQSELEQYLREHPDLFREEPRTSFRHVFLSEERGERLAADAAEVLAELRAAGPDSDGGDLGDGLRLVPSEFRLEPSRGVASLLGPEFAEALDGAPVGEWTGPLPSAFGAHLVLVTERQEGRAPALDEVRGAVRRELLGERRERMNRELLERLLERYTVTIEWPEVDGAPAGTPDGEPAEQPAPR